MALLHLYSGANATVDTGLLLYSYPGGARPPRSKSQVLLVNTQAVFSNLKIPTNLCKKQHNHNHAQAFWNPH